MKFFEFNDFGYYALIGAASKEEAMNEYEEGVSDLNESDGEPEEITEECAREKLLDVCEKSVPISHYASKSGMESVIQEGKDGALSEFEKNIKNSEPYLILIDSTLI